jgi:hypothetical protein
MMIGIIMLGLMFALAAGLVWSAFGSARSLQYGPPGKPGAWFAVAVLGVLAGAMVLAVAAFTLEVVGNPAILKTMNVWEAK